MLIVKWRSRVLDSVGLPSLRHQIPSDASAGVALDVYRCAIALAENAIAAVSARSGEGRPRLRMSSFDSILIRPRESIPHLVEPSWAAN